MKKKISVIYIEDYVKASKKIIKKLFGKKIYKQLKSIPLKSINYDGVDIDCSSITATFPNIKERFSPKWVSYFAERDRTALDMIILSIFHLGYQHAINTEVSVNDLYPETKGLLDRIKSEIEALNKEENYEE